MSIVCVWPSSAFSKYQMHNARNSEIRKGNGYTLERAERPACAGLPFSLIEACQQFEFVFGVGNEVISASTIAAEALHHIAAS